MSIPAFMAGFIKYGERTWVLLSVSRDKFGKIVPFGNVDSDSDLGNNYTLEDKNYIHGLCIAHRCVKAFKEFTEYYDMENNGFRLQSRIEVDDISEFWDAIEVEMGLMFDLLYTKAPINFRKRGCILRCITFSCTVAVLIGLVIRVLEGREKWHKVDIAITEVLLVGALALEIYAIISLHLFSDWAMLWLIKNNKAELKYVPKTAVIDPSLLLHPISKCCIHLIDPRIEEDIMIRTIEDDPIWEEFFDSSFENQIHRLHTATEVCYNLEIEWDTHDAADQNNRDGNRELCRILSRYMMYLFVMRSSLLPIAASYDYVRDKFFLIEKSKIGDAPDVMAACRYLSSHPIVELLKSKQKDLRWEMLKWVWVRMLCYAVSKGQRNEHFRQLRQGGEFLTFLWFFLPQSEKLVILP
ncbi:uncharacterized protein LOC131327872 [Rhododendron vialii]|uniref:uncharacterized protein LOC131327872 n=1 Tax=Rhododendron vialii TaxID=182163 RepID=UPI00265F91D2|nr:uncharacterized protein LOC131327872 [Rhododendron vialii]